MMHRQTPSLQLTKKNPITDIPYMQRRIICAKLDINNDWKKFVGFIRSKNSSTPRYTDLHMCLFEKEGQKKHGSPTDSLLNDWKTLRPTIGDLLELLIDVELLDTADYIHSKVLEAGSIKIPREQPNDGRSARVMLSQVSSSYTFLSFRCTPSCFWTAKMLVYARLGRRWQEMAVSGLEYSNYVDFQMISGSYYCTQSFITLSHNAQCISHWR